MAVPSPMRGGLRRAGLRGRIRCHAPRVRRAPAAAAPLAFQDVAKAAGLAVQHVNGASPEKFLVETMGSGAVFFDYDADGWVDVFLVDGGSLADPAVAARARHRLFRNLGNGKFADVTAASAITSPEYGQGACAGDVDNDGRIDLYLTNYGANALFRNAGNGAFADVTRAAGVGLGGWSTSCAFLDVDRDGDLDLFVANYLDAPQDQQPVLRRSAAAHPRLLPPAELQGPAERALPQRRQGHVHRRQRQRRHRAARRQRPGRGGGRLRR